MPTWAGSLGGPEDHGQAHLLRRGEDGHRLAVPPGGGRGAPARGLRDVPGREGAAPAELGGAALRPAAVRALVLTHTHLDHIGRVPRLVKQGFRGDIFCTPPTRDLAEVLLLDSAHLQMEDAEYLNRKKLTKHEPALPLYDSADVEACLKLFRAVPLGQDQAVGEAFSFRYRDAGHLLGAASVEMTVREGGQDHARRLQRRRRPLRRGAHQGPRALPRGRLRRGREHLRQPLPRRRGHRRAARGGAASAPSPGAACS